MILVEPVFCVCGRVVLHFNKLLEFCTVFICKLTGKCDLPFDIEVWTFFALGWNARSWSALDFSFFLLSCVLWGSLWAGRCPVTQPLFGRSTVKKLVLIATVVVYLWPEFKMPDYHWTADDTNNSFAVDFQNGSLTTPFFLSLCTLSLY